MKKTLHESAGFLLVAGVVLLAAELLASAILGMLYYQKPALAAFVTVFLIQIAYKN
jgi:membrane protein implicated in regulation of membrane protease activity